MIMMMMQIVVCEWLQHSHVVLAARFARPGDLCSAEAQQDPCPVADPPAAGHPSGGRGQERDQFNPPVCPQLPLRGASWLVQQISVHADCRWVRAVLKICWIRFTTCQHLFCHRQT